MDGFLVIDKPAGWTSHDVVARVRRLAGQKRVGHSGTLDPDATGVLLVCLGSATRLIEYTEDFHKVYRAVLALGVATDTEDASGTVTARHDASAVNAGSLADVLPGFRGDILQVPPMVSAVHHAGRRLYEIAREGGTVERSPRPVTIYSLEAHGFEPGETARAQLIVECSSGTYVRTLCADIGAALGVGGHMETLRRTAIGPFGEDAAHTLDALATQGVEACLRHPVELIPQSWPRVECEAAMVDEIRHGRPVPAITSGALAVAVTEGRILAVLNRDDAVWRPVKVFPPE